MTGPRDDALGREASDPTIPGSGAESAKTGAVQGGAASRADDDPSEALPASDTSLRSAAGGTPVRSPLDAETASFLPTAGGRLTVRAVEPDRPLASFGDYELIQLIARGGMGAVYKARQKKLHRIVALKMILAGRLASAEDVQRFYLEAEAAAQLEHPGIVPIFEMGEHAGQHFFSMSFVEGGSLADRVRAGPLPSRAAAELIARVAEAVAYAHSRGIIHRDLKPANILLDKDGHPKVSDFGLAKITAGDSQLTLAGQILGTPTYMAPEQSAGKTEALAAADIYSLGAILYCLLTGRPPFQSVDVMETLRQVRQDEPVPPRRLNRGVEQDLETICLKCLQKEPWKRYASAEALAADLRHFLAGEPILARRVGRVERLWRWCRRNPVPATLIGMVFASLLLGTATTSYYWLQASQRAAEAIDQARRAEKEKTWSDHRWYAAEIHLTQRHWQDAQFATLLQRLDRLKPQHPEALDLRGFEWDYLEGLCRLDLRTIGAHAGPARAVAFSPDGRRLASGGGKFGEKGDVKVWECATGRELLHLSGFNNYVSCVAFSRDGKWLAAANGGVRDPGAIKIWDAAGGRLVHSAAHAVPVFALAFSPDGRRLASAATGIDKGGTFLPGELKIWDTANGKEVLHVPGHAGLVQCIAFSPDGRHLAFSDGTTVRVCDPSTGREPLTSLRHSSMVTGVAYGKDGRLASTSAGGEIRVWDPATGQESLALHDPGVITSVAFSPDGRRLATGTTDRIVKVWNVTGRTEVLTLRGHKEAVLDLAYSPDGWRLASASEDGLVKIWDAISPAERVNVGSFSAIISRIDFAPDGRHLAVADSSATAHIVDTSATGVAVRLDGHAGRVTCVAYGAGGRRLATAAEDRTVRIWDPAEGTELFCLRGHGGPVGSVSFSRDGRILASASTTVSFAGRRFPGEIKIWDALKGELIRTLPGSAEGVDQGALHDVAVSPDGARLAAAEGRLVRVWDTDTGQQLFTLRAHNDTVTRVAYSADGRQLASASRDKSVRVWDASTGEEILKLPGHAVPVWSVAFSPDGRRLASAGGGATAAGGRHVTEVKVWDTLTGQELLTLYGPHGQSASVVFSPDGQRLALSGDNDVMIWQGMGGADVAEKREAQALVKFLLSERLPKGDVLARIGDDPTISDSVRQRALGLVEPSWQGQVRQEAARKVGLLFAKRLFESEVIEQLRADATLSEPVRATALALAEKWVPSASSLIRDAWQVARRPGAEPAAYRRALQLAELACRLLPFEGRHHTTLGMAQYRLGQYEEALATLTRADELNQARYRISDPADMAVLGMTYARLGRKDQARESLASLTRAAPNQPRAVQEETDNLRQEAEALLAGETRQNQK